MFTLPTPPLAGYMAAVIGVVEDCVRPWVVGDTLIVAAADG